MKLVECVPNFSEGRRKEVIQAIRDAAASVNGVTVLDCENDENHNRMVLTLVGAPESVKEGALAASEVAVRLIDLREHSGEHPRMGAVDVVPFVPLGETTMNECIQLAKSFAENFASRFGVPVFLYEEAASSAERKDLARVRDGQFETLREVIGKDPSRRPDFGPERIHPSAGATAVGARQILVAYNINLRSEDLSIAKRIARQVRGRDGGLSFVKALGFELKDKQMVQVSMNLTDYKRSSMYKAFELVSLFADRYGITVSESEVVGLVPQEALIDSAEYFLKLRNFSRNQIIENRLFDTGSGVRTVQANENLDYSKLTLSEFASSISSINPVPGGGSVSACAGLFAASLVAMVCRLTIGKKGYEQFEQRMKEILSDSLSNMSLLQDLVNKDAEAFNMVSAALKLPKESEDQRKNRSEKLAEAFKRATEVPLSTMKYSSRVLRLAREIREIGNKNARSDAETAIEMSIASIRGAWSNVKINLESLSKEREYVDRISNEAKEILRQIEQ
jgi:glutamate formiminotransferase/formiminotetrahydrofolate cyclodeaminase